MNGRETGKTGHMGLDFKETAAEITRALDDIECCRRRGVSMTAQLPQRLTAELWSQIHAHRAVGVMDKATYREVVGCYGPRDRKGYLLLLHPDESPAHVGPVSGCVNPPSRFRSNAKFKEFRDTCVIPMIEARPDDANWPLMLAQIEKILAWRAAIPAEDRFWKSDPDPV